MIIIDILKCLACILIFFYHCNTILPGEWKALTLFGQDLGNCLFFMISGFALCPSIQKSSLRDFPAWYLKRLKRIAPILILSYAASYFSGFYSLQNPAQVFAVFVFPTLYWFISAILLFYILLFFLGKTLPDHVLLAVSVLFMALYECQKDSMLSFYFIGFGNMLIGFLLRKKDLRKTRLFFVSFILSLTVYLALKFLPENVRNGAYHHLLTGLAVTLLNASALKLGELSDEALKKRIPERIHLSLRRIGNMALPVYLVQCFNSGAIGFFIGQKIPFPYSFLVNFILVWGIAGLLHFILAKRSVYYDVITK